MVIFAWEMDAGSFPCDRPFFLCFPFFFFFFLRWPRDGGVLADAVHAARVVHQTLRDWPRGRRCGLGQRG